MLCSGLWAFGWPYSPRPYNDESPNLSSVRPPVLPPLSSAPRGSGREIRSVFSPVCWRWETPFFFVTSSLNNPSVPELLTHLVTLLCTEFVSDISVSIYSDMLYMQFISAVIMLIFLYVSYHVALSLRHCRDWWLSCWYSKVLIFSTLELFLVLSGFVRCYHRLCHIFLFSPRWPRDVTPDVNVAHGTFTPINDKRRPSPGKRHFGARSCPILTRRRAQSNENKVG